MDDDHKRSFSLDDASKATTQGDKEVKQNTEQTIFRDLVTKPIQIVNLAFIARQLAQIVRTLVGLRLHHRHPVVADHRAARSSRR